MDIDSIQEMRDTLKKGLERFCEPASIYAGTGKLGRTMTIFYMNVRGWADLGWPGLTS